MSRCLARSRLQSRHQSKNQTESLSITFIKCFKWICLSCCCWNIFYTLNRRVSYCVSLIILFICNFSGGKHSKVGHHVYFIMFNVHLLWQNFLDVVIPIVTSCHESLMRTWHLKHPRDGDAMLASRRHTWPRPRRMQLVGTWDLETRRHGDQLHTSGTEDTAHVTTSTSNS